MSTTPRWRKSSRSNTQTNCVEINHGEARFGVRDSKASPSSDPEISAQHGHVFLSLVKAGKLRLP